MRRLEFALAVGPSPGPDPLHSIAHDPPLQSRESIPQDAVATISGPLTPPEIALLAEAVAWVGDAKNRWELICREYLPARQPKV